MRPMPCAAWAGSHGKRRTRARLRSYPSTWARPPDRGAPRRGRRRSCRCVRPTWRRRRDRARAPRTRCERCRRGDLDRGSRSARRGRTRRRLAPRSSALRATGAPPYGATDRRRGHGTRRTCRCRRRDRRGRSCGASIPRPTTSLQSRRRDGRSCTRRRSDFAVVTRGSRCTRAVPSRSTRAEGAHRRDRGSSRRTHARRDPSSPPRQRVRYRRGPRRARSRGVHR